MEKTETQERCPHCGFLTSTVHDRRTRKVRDLAIFRQPVYLFVEVKRYRCWNCFQVFSASFESIPPNQHYTNHVASTCMNFVKAESTVSHIRHWNAFITPSHRKKQKSAKQRWRPLLQKGWCLA
nr:transposase family protein [Parageobacillus sp. G301]